MTSLKFPRPPLPGCGPGSYVMIRQLFLRFLQGSENLSMATNAKLEDFESAVSELDDPAFDPRIQTLTGFLLEADRLIKELPSASTNELTDGLNRREIDLSGIKSRWEDRKHEIGERLVALKGFITGKEAMESELGEMEERLKDGGGGWEEKLEKLKVL